MNSGIAVDGNKTKQLYFIAVIPPSPILEECMGIKEYFRDAYQSKASLNSPPHITLHMPFLLKVKKEEKLERVLAEFGKGFFPFEVHLKNFDAFPPRVIFMAVKPNEQLNRLQGKLLETFKQKLNLFNANYKDAGFHPHITLAFRDLKKPKFTEAWEEFKDKNYRASFEVNAIHLLKHDGSQWQIFRTFGLSAE